MCVGSCQTNICQVWKKQIHLNGLIYREQSTDEMFSSEGKFLQTSVCWFIKQFQCWWWKLSFENICWLFVARCWWIVGGKVIYMYIYQGTTEGKLTLSVWCIVWIISLAVYTCLCRGTRKEEYIELQHKPTFWSSGVSKNQNVTGFRVSAFRGNFAKTKATYLWKGFYCFCTIWFWKGHTIYVICKSTWKIYFFLWTKNTKSCHEPIV